MTTEWISTAERLPEDHVDILLYKTWAGFDEIVMGRYAPPYPLRPEDGCEFTDVYGDPIVGFVTHWMPLPEPPQKGDGKQ